MVDCGLPGKGVSMAHWDLLRLELLDRRGSRRHTCMACEKAVTFAWLDVEHREPRQWHAERGA